MIKHAMHGVRFGYREVSSALLILHCLKQSSMCNKAKRFSHNVADKVHPIASSKDRSVAGNHWKTSKELSNSRTSLC